MPEIITNPVKDIRAFCLECCGGNQNYVKDCSAPNCALYAFRLGRNPYRTKREYTPEQLEQMRERARKMQEARRS